MSGVGYTFGNKCEGNLHFPSWPSKALKNMGVFENKHKFAILRGEIKSLFYQGNQKGANYYR
jgi:hypothetical protein